MSVFSFYSKVLFVVVSILVGLTAKAQKKHPDEIAIRHILQRQVGDWNKGNREDFMRGYWQSDSLVFVGKNGLKYGYTTTLQNYKTNYPDTIAMGKLNFDLLQVKQLSPQYYFVIGKWTLQRSIGNLGGHFTLLFRKIKNSWVIIADHSS